jgi:hypothetical protein
VAAQIATLDQMKRTGLRALVELIVPPYDEEQVIGLILGLGDRPEIWGWYLADEPDLRAGNGLCPGRRRARWETDDSMADTLRS